MYAVTGATGQFGRLAIASLRNRVDTDQIVALVRDPAKAAGLAADGIEVRLFDYDAPDQLEASLKGVKRLLFVSSDTPDRRIPQHQAVINAASAADVELLAYTSILHADWNPISVAQSHHRTERMIAASGIPHVILRNSWYIENYLIGAHAAIEHGALHGSTGKGAISAASRADFAEGAATVLTTAAGPNQTYELAGDEAFTLSDVANVLSQAGGREVKYIDMPEDDYRAALVDAGVPADFAAALAEYSANASGGILADHSGTLGALLGRPTATMRETLLAALTTKSGGDD